MRGYWRFTADTRSAAGGVVDDDIPSADRLQQSHDPCFAGIAGGTKGRGATSADTGRAPVATATTGTHCRGRAVSNYIVRAATASQKEPAAARDPGGAQPAPDPTRTAQAGSAGLAVRR